MRVGRQLRPNRKNVDSRCLSPGRPAGTGVPRGLDVPFVVDRFRVRRLCHSDEHEPPCVGQHICLSRSSRSPRLHQCALARPSPVRRLAIRQPLGMLFCSSGIPNQTPPAQKSHEQQRKWLNEVSPYMIKPTIPESRPPFPKPSHTFLPRPFRFRHLFFLP